jgi:hypothetical protein
MATYKWPFGKEDSLEFTIHDANAAWSPAAGVYIFAFAADPAHWCALYVGQTDNFRARIPNHELWAQAVQLGATHVHALEVRRANIRDIFERGLIESLKPMMNIQIVETRL